MTASSSKSVLAKLTGGIARIKVGGATELEVNHRKELIEDALQACRARARGGCAPGREASRCCAAFPRWTRCAKR